MEFYGTIIDDMSVRQINRLFRAHDDSHMFPIRGRFNVTERAIRRLARQRHDGLEINPGPEYALALDAEIRRIVNNPAFV